MRKVKLASVFALLALLLSTMSGAVMADESPHSQENVPLILSGTTYLEVPTQKLGGPTTSAVLQVDQFQIQSAEVEIIGKMKYDYVSYPIHVSGVFYQSGLGHPGDKVAEARDLTEHFEILHMAVRLDPGSEALQLDRSISGPVLILYLQRLGTREITVIETPVAQAALQDKVMQLLRQEKYEQASFGLDFWQPKIFEPTESGEQSVGLRAAQDNDIREYAEFYWVTGQCWVRYKIRFQAYSNGPDDIGRGSADFNHKLEVLRKWTESNCAFYRKEDSPFFLGKYADPAKAKVKAYGNDSSTGDVFLKGRFNGNFEWKWFPRNVELELGLSYAIASVNWSIPLTHWAEPDKNMEVIYSQTDPDEWTKLAKYTYRDRSLRDTGQYFQAIVQNAYGEGGRYTKTLQARWKVPIYADYGHRTTCYPETTLNYYSG